MNAADKKAQAEARRYSPFWVCLLVFALLAGEHTIGLLGLWDQHQQLRQTRTLQEQNMQILQQRPQMEGALQAFTMDLLAVARTNTAARQIVQEFNIQWTPGTNAAPAAAPAATERK